MEMENGLCGHVGIEEGSGNLMVVLEVSLLLCI